MKTTNKHKIPKHIAKWLEKDEYDYTPNTFSATTLMTPPRAYALKKQFKEELEVDVSDFFAARRGDAIHQSIEKIKIPKAHQEKRMHFNIGADKITGKPDIIMLSKKKWQIRDIKTTSVNTLIFNSRDEDYKIQLSIYRYLLTKNPIDDKEVSDIGIIDMLFTDWSRYRVKMSSEYPSCVYYEKKVQLMSIEETEDYIKGRINMLKMVVEYPQSHLPQCDDKELWATKKTYALMKPGRKTAIKLFQTEGEANAFISTKSVVMKFGQDIHIEIRPSKAVRCAYCSARAVCTQYARMKEEGRAD